MPVTNGKFDYPQQGWSTGSMRKVGDNGPQTMSKEEWEAWLSGPPEAPRLRYKARDKLDNAIRDHPDGFVVDKDHPGLKDIRDQLDLFNLPTGAQEGEPYFARPKPQAPATSGLPQQMAKMLPTGREATTLLEQAAGRSRGKRKEAEAM